MIIGISTRTRPQESRGKDRNSLIHKNTRPAKVQDITAAILGIGGGFELQPMCGDRQVADGATVKSLPQESNPAGIQFQWWGEPDLHMLVASW